MSIHPTIKIVGPLDTFFMEWFSDKIQARLDSILIEQYSKLRHKSIFVGCDLSNTVIVGENPANYEFIGCNTTGLNFLTEDDYLSGKRFLDPDLLFYKRFKKMQPSRYSWSAPNIPKLTIPKLIFRIPKVIEDDFVSRAYTFNDEYKPIDYLHSFMLEALKQKVGYKPCRFLN